MIFEDYDETEYQEAMKTYAEMKEQEGIEEGSSQRARETAIRML